MSQSFKKFSCKTDSFRRFFSRLVSSDHQHESIIEDDWEFVEFLDLELSDKEDDSTSLSGQEDVEMVIPGKNIKMRYTILTKDDIRRHLEEKITKVSEVLLLTRNEAAILLQHFKWNVNQTNDEWMACEEKVRDAVGLFLKPVVDTPADAADEIACSLCYEDFSRDLMHSASCGHQICPYCWEGHLREAIDNDGPRCLTLLCPETSCEAAVGVCLIEQLLTSEDLKKKFETYLLRSYFSCSEKRKWCPAPDCNCAVLSETGVEDKVTCKCLHSFCWECSLEVHSPVDCGTANVWMSEGSRQSENWVYAKATACPSCKWKHEIPESQDPTDAICTMCEHEFCWACGDDWKNNQATAATHLCIRNADDDHKLFVEKNLERYNRYYEGWALCESARENALADLKLFQEMQLDLSCVAVGEIAFVGEALKVVVECWQFLKWTHAYGYFSIPPDGDISKRNLFEFIQGDATGLVKKLQKYMDEYQYVLFEDVEFQHFAEYSNRIITLTRVLRRYFDRLEAGLLVGINEVNIPMQRSSPSPTPAPAPEQGENSCKRENPDVNSSSSPKSKVMTCDDDTRTCDLNLSSWEPLDDSSIMFEDF